MMAVLGIDAAWTATNPSGIALAVQTAGAWDLVAVASSYEHFNDLSQGTTTAPLRHSGSLPHAGTLLSAVQALCGRLPDVVAIDMPLSGHPITGRRTSDDAISRAYGGRHASTHTPSVHRPGPISDRLTADFAEAGYPLRTLTFEAPGLIEVYPHPALIELAAARVRLPYKASKVRKYWPLETPIGRRELLLNEWRAIINRLDAEIGGVAAAIPLPELAASGAVMKACEDAIDAVVCAWVGIRVVEGRARSFGDDGSAIWVPK